LQKRKRAVRAGEGENRIEWLFVQKSGYILEKFAQKYKKFWDASVLLDKSEKA
jgi:hypothetical protein